MAELLADQQARVLSALTRWADAAPGRRFTIERTEDGWKAQLDERRCSTGTTWLDAASQIAFVAGTELYLGESLDES